MSFDISCHSTFHVIWHFMTFHVMWRFMSFGVSCHLAFHVIWRFMSFGISCHLAFHVIWRFMSFGVSCDLSDHCNHSHQSLHGINAQSCYRGPVCLQKVALRIVIGRYCYKSSFGAKNDRPGDDGTLRSV